MEALIPILISVAAKVGAPLLKSVLTKHVGPLAGSVAGDVIDAVAKNAGVTVDALPSVAADDLTKAVQATEAETPEILAQWVESQKLANELQVAEMAKEPLWAWGWRPAWMWFLGFLWAWLVVMVPLANAITGARITTVDAQTLFTLTGAYLALYMGGHTVKSVFSK